MDEHKKYSGYEVIGKNDDGADTDPLKGFFELPFREFMDNSRLGFLITDDQDTLLWINDIFFGHPLIGPELKLLLNRPAVHGIDYLRGYMRYPETFSHKMHALLKKREPQFDTKVYLIDDTILKIDYIPIFQADQFSGAIWQFTLCLEQQTQWKALKNSDTSFVETFDKFNISYCEIKEDGSIARVSPFFCKFIGFSEEELERINFLSLCISGKQHVEACLQNRNSSILTRNTSSFELELKVREDTKWVQCHTFANVSAIGLPLGCMLFMTEITEQKNIQRELENAKKNAEDAQIAQQQFLASVAHDIRTPLNAIIGMTLLMADTSLDKEQREYIKVLKNASNILLDLLNGILDFAKIESGRQEIHQKEFDLPLLLSSLIDTFSFKLNEKPVELHCDIDPEIDRFLVGDHVLLNQILMNLLANAEKFTTKGTITLKASIVKKYENTVWIRFRVEDTGIGISKEDMEKIFQDFMQADEDIRINYGGSGLGLFICKRLVEMMGGRVTVESTKGKGTVFNFSLPFEATDKPTGKVRTQAVSSELLIKDDIQILVVEDNPMNLAYLSSLLKKHDIAFDTATDGKIALEYAKRNYYNLILMDMKLPKMGGMKVTSTIRQTQNPNTATPIILLSATTSQNTFEQAQKAGVNDMLTKPYTPEQLLNLLQKYLNDDEPEEDMKNKRNDVFEFNEKLDTEYLHKLYSGNCSYAKSLFDIFLECTEDDWAEIKQQIQESEWENLKDLVHKIKPNFSMVGLTWITEMIQNAYNELKEGNHDAAVRLLQDVQEELDQYMPLIREEYQRMQQYVLSRKFPE